MPAGAGCRVVTPPALLLVISGTVGVGGAAGVPSVLRLLRGTYGVYVVWGPVGGCRGGGGSGPTRTGGGGRPFPFIAPFTAAEREEREGSGVVACTGDEGREDHSEEGVEDVVEPGVAAGMVSG